MGDNGTGDRYKLVQLGESKIVYLGVNVTNASKSVILFAQSKDLNKFSLSKDSRDFNLWVTLSTFIGYQQMEEGELDCDGPIEIDGINYWVKEWTRSFDRELVTLIDQLISMRMKNASVVSLSLQLEMPL